eukprot:scaffold135187_cov15-Tisochrysis_lutea.AAC.1
MRHASAQVPPQPNSPVIGVGLELVGCRREKGKRTGVLRRVYEPGAAHVAGRSQLVCASHHCTQDAGGQGQACKGYPREAAQEYLTFASLA